MPLKMEKISVRVRAKFFSANEKEAGAEGLVYKFFLLVESKKLWNQWARGRI